MELLKGQLCVSTQVFLGMFATQHHRLHLLNFHLHSYPNLKQSFSYLVFLLNLYVFVGV